MKKLICVILLVFTLVVLTACGDKDNSRVFKPALDTNTSCSITVIGSYDNFEALEAEFDRFNEYYPNVKLSYVKKDKYETNLPTILDSNDKPNIFFSFASMIGKSGYESVFEHMENLSDPALKLNLDCIRPGLINHDSEGNVLMVPVLSRTYGMLVNKDLFKKESLSIPTTLSELNSVCQALKDKGYESPMMGYSASSSSCLMYTVAYPMFMATLANNAEALKQANEMNPAAGEYMRPALEAVKQLIDSEYIDLKECDKIAGNYTEVILRFFEGDVPMMICAGDTVSGTKKREKQSEAFSKSPFEYTFAPIPMTADGGYFIDSPSIEFSVNKYCDNLDMTNEFMRFLLSNQELNNLASIKRLLTPTKDLSFDTIYAPFGQIPTNRTFSPEVLGIVNDLTVQIRVAAYRVGKGELTVDEAIALYGTFS